MTGTWRAAVTKAALAVALASAGWIMSGCGASASSDELLGLMKARNLKEADVEAALKTYTPSGATDPYLMFASGGHAGNVLVIGVPSMRILDTIPIFTREPYYGYGYEESTRRLLRAGNRPGGPELNFGDVHHPALSETNGDYDGRYLFVNDKANARVAVIDLRDFATKQIVANPLVVSDHALYVTPNTRYVVEGGQYPAPLGGAYEPLRHFNDRYRSAVTFWRFDAAHGRIDPGCSFAIELPPYMQDIGATGKLASAGWVFLNSFDTERAHGGDLEGRPPLEAGASQNDMDYLHLIDLAKAEKVAFGAGVERIAGMRVIPLKVAVKDGLLYFVGEPKSPHGCDVTPDGKDVVVSGKLDTHVTVFSFAKMRGLIAARRFAGTDPYGVPVLPFAESIRGQVEVGLGPLHTQFDGRGNAYTSLFIECAVAKWSLESLKVVEKHAIQYNVGHICVPGGDTEHPDGRYLVSMNKWSIDRFADVGPMMPRNFQLLDIGGPSMQLLYDMPVAYGEPHYAQMIRADRLKPAIQVYSPVGTDPETFKMAAAAVTGGRERIRRGPGAVDVYMTAVRSHFTPDTIRVTQGDRVRLHLTNLEQSPNAIHGFALDTFGISEDLEPGKEVDVDFVADRPGVFPFYCTDFCSALHLEMEGYLLVRPRGGPSDAL